MSYKSNVDTDGITIDPYEIQTDYNNGGSSGGRGGDDFWAAVIGAIVDFFNGIFNRRAQRKENEADRKFNAEQAEINRQWQEEQYKKYESVAAQMQQRQQAGLNPNDQIQAMSVGSGSTASSSSHSLPPMDFSLFAQLPAMFAGLQKTKAETESVKIKNQTDLLLLRQEAIKTGDFESYWSSIVAEQGNKKKLSEWEWKQKRAEAYKTFHDARLSEVKADEAEDAYDDGVNTIIDESNYKQAQTALVNATANLTDSNRESVEFALQLSKKFDEEFLNLSLSERRQQVKEFLDQAPIRESLAKFAQTMQDNATQISNREVALNEVQSRIVRDMLLAVESNMNSDNIIDNIQAVVAFSYVTNPAATISAITNLIPDLSIKNNSSKTTHTHYDTGTRFTTINN